MVLVPFIFPLFRVLLRRADSNNLTVNFNIDVFLFHARKIGAQDVRLVVFENINRDDASPLVSGAREPLVPGVRVTIGMKGFPEERDESWRKLTRI